MADDGGESSDDGGEVTVPASAAETPVASSSAALVTVELLDVSAIDSRCSAQLLVFGVVLTLRCTCC